MKLIDILGIVSRTAYHTDKEENLAYIASQISIFKDSDRLFFNNASLTSPITEELLNSDLKVSPYIVFEEVNNIWTAFELYSEQKVVDFCENTKEKQSNRLVLRDLDKLVISNTNTTIQGNLDVEDIKGTKIIRVLPY